MQETNKVKLIETAIISFLKNQKTLNSSTVEILLEHMIKDQTQPGIDNVLKELNKNLSNIFYITLNNNRINLIFKQDCLVKPVDFSDLEKEIFQTLKPAFSHFSSAIANDLIKKADNIAKQTDTDDDTDDYQNTVNIPVSAPYCFIKFFAGLIHRDDQFSLRPAVNFVIEGKEGNIPYPTQFKFTHFKIAANDFKLPDFSQYINKLKDQADTEFCAVDKAFMTGLN